MRIDVCKEKLDCIVRQINYVKARMIYDDCINERLIKDITSAIEYALMKYRNAKANGDLYVSNVKKPLNRAKRDLMRLLEEYTQEEQKRLLKVFKVLSRLGE